MNLSFDAMDLFSEEPMISTLQPLHLTSQRLEEDMLLTPPSDVHVTSIFDWEKAVVIAERDPHTPVSMKPRADTKSAPDMTPPRIRISKENALKRHLNPSRLIITNLNIDPESRRKKRKRTSKLDIAVADFLKNIVSPKTTNHIAA
eukprot:CAMPEP_0185279420 /NCGR_PEP_ID=MMETSP1359-20130426/63509_1 /TAXON_ID=552665 /ORGANISM="Bigelowiella longifila, Strain CCMP242" /LENGTH=145 /DNA_ID=CAMNT_0027874297 /DNA_START=14 /DNA_END=451 /DNA_ORIENTATION=+